MPTVPPERNKKSWQQTGPQDWLASQGLGISLTGPETPETSNNGFVNTTETDL